MSSRVIESRHVSGTGMKLTEIGFGAASIGNLFRETSDEEAAGAVDRAWQRGIRYFDTAPHYGLGLSERRLGRFLKSRPRDEYALSTKVGRLLVPNHNQIGIDQDFVVPDVLSRQWDFSRDGIWRSLDASLSRLGTDHVDILYLHDPEQHSESSAWEGAEVLTEMRDQGVIRSRGIGTNAAWQIGPLFEADAIDIAMLAGRYTLMEQSDSLTAMTAAFRTGKSLVAAGVFNSGLTANDRPSVTDHYDYRAAPSDLIERANRIAEMCENVGVSLPQAAIAFPLLNPRVSSVTLGMRSAAQVDRNVDLWLKSAPSELWRELDATGLVPGDPTRETNSN